MTFTSQQTSKIRKRSNGNDGVYVTEEISDSNPSVTIFLGFAAKKVAVQADGTLNYNILHSLNGVDFESDAGNQNKSSPDIIPITTTQDHPITSVRIVQNTGGTSGKVVIAAT